jgi:hypothetical protein
MPLLAVSGDLPQHLTTIVSANVGLPGELPNALAATCNLQASNLVLIEDCGVLQEREFFRAPAKLHLPTQRSTVGVAALVVRPGGRSTHLRLAGTFAWPDDERQILDALEAIIQTHADQWIPERSLWDAPAERILGDEVR